VISPSNSQTLLKSGIVFSLAVLFQFAMAEDKGVTWASIDPFCGQITSSEPREFPIKSAKIKLYRAKVKHVPCCQAAEQLEDVKIDKDGNFDLRKISPGQYWFIVSWKTTEVPVALWFDGKHDFACDERYKNVIEIKPSTKTVERLVMTSTDSLAHAQTH
jgi:hypothetical protein